MSGKFRAQILICSDRVASGERKDLAGPKLSSRLETEGWEVHAVDVLPDEIDRITAWLTTKITSNQCDLILTSGGTGVAERDVTPEATLQVIEKRIPGLEEAMRSASIKITPHAMLSRGIAGAAGTTLIINLPGSPKGAVENLEVVLPALPHAIALVKGEKPDP